MRVGIDGACWLNRRGYGRFARELVWALARLGGTVEYSLMIDFDPLEAPPLPAAVRVVRVASRRPAARAAAATGQRSLRDLWAMTRAIQDERFDVMFFPSAYTYVPVLGAARVVVVIHDVIAEQFPAQVFPTRRGAVQWWLKLLAARRRADLVLTVSEASRTGIARRFKIAPHKIVVIPEAASPLFRQLPADAHDQAPAALLQRWQLAERGFLLYVGGISPHKNLAVLIDAVAALRRRPATATLKLAIVGDHSGDVFFSAYEELRRQCAALQLGDAVVFTGYVDDAALVVLYNRAAAFVLPSLAEGFGLPVLEALACGTPVVTSARGALPEVLGAAGMLFDPDRKGDLEAVLAELLGDGDVQERLRRLGPARAAEFSWERAARQTLAALQEVTGTTRGEAAPMTAAREDGARWMH